MTSESVARALVQLAVFLEFSPVGVVNSDAAVQALEQLSSTLNEADTETKSALVSHFDRISNRYSGKEAGFVATLAETLGLTEERS